MNHRINLTQERLAEAIQACVWGVEAGGKVLTISDAEQDRSAAQNALSFKLYEHIDKHGKTTNAREYCKYHFGVPILIGDDSEMMRLFKTVMSKLDYESRLTAMELLPVTSLMKVKQFTRYLERIYDHYDPQGYQLPKPDDIYYKAMGYTRRAA